MPASRRASATTAMPLPRRAAMRPAHSPQRGRAGIVEAEHRDRGLDEEPAHPARARFGDPPPALRLPRAQLARDQPQIGLDLLRPAEAGGVVERGHEGRRRHRPDIGHALQAPHPLVCLRDRGDPLIRVGELLLEVAHDGQQRRDLGAQPTRQGQRHHAPAEPLRAPRRHRPAVLAEQGAD